MIDSVAAAQVPSPAAIFMRTALARSYPRWRAMGRDRSWLFLETVLPLIGTVAMIYVYKGLHAPDRFLGFVVMGGAMLAYWTNVLWSMGTQLYWDRDSGNLELYAISPCSFVAVLCGMALGGLIASTVRAFTVIVVASLLFDVHYVWSAIPAAFGVFLLALLALYGLGALMASLFLFYAREAWHVAHGLQEPVYFISGFYFPVHSLGAALGAVGSLLPITFGLDAMRQLLLPGTPSFVAPGWEVLVLAVQVPVYAWLARAALRVMEMRSRRDGRLMLRGG